MSPALPSDFVCADVNYSVRGVVDMPPSLTLVRLARLKEDLPSPQASHVGNLHFMAV